MMPLTLVTIVAGCIMLGVCVSTLTVFQHIVGQVPLDTSLKTMFLLHTVSAVLSGTLTGLVLSCHIAEYERERGAPLLPRNYGATKDDDLTGQRWPAPAQACL